MKYRTSIEICYQMLRAMRKKVSKSSVTYKVRINNRQLNEFLDMMLDIGLVKEIEYLSRKKYVITEKGREFLKEYKEFRDRVKKYYQLPLL